MKLDLYVDTSRKGISIAISSPFDVQKNTNEIYEEIIDKNAKGESLSFALDNLLNKTNTTLENIKRVLVTIGPGSFSGLRTGVAFCQGLCFNGNRELYGVSTLKALQYFTNERENSAVILRARTDYWYFRINETESFIETKYVIQKLKTDTPKSIVVDEFANQNNELNAFFLESKINLTLDTGFSLYKWEPLFKIIKPSLIQEANYIQPSYFEKLKM